MFDQERRVQEFNEFQKKKIVEICFSISDEVEQRSILDVLVECKDFPLRENQVFNKYLEDLCSSCSVETRTGFYECTCVRKANQTDEV